MKELIVDGKRYVPAEQHGPIKIVVLVRGFVYVGLCDDSDPLGLTVSGARSLIRWGTDEHLGQLTNGPLENTKLGAPCVVKARWKQILHTIEVNQDAWTQHVN